MKLQEVFDQLTYGELSQLSIGGGQAGVIDPSNYSRVLAHVNLGLTALYKRFNLKQGRITVELDPARVEYPLIAKFAVTTKASKEPVRYIKDTSTSPFKADILKIERVLGDSGFEYNLNMVDDKLSIVTPTSTTLRVPKDILVPPDDLPQEMRTANLEILYRANHPQMMIDTEEMDEDDIAAIELELPDTHLEPLLLFVAARAHSPIGMQQEGAAGINWFQRYEASCMEIENKGLRVDEDSQQNKLQRNGWA
jgi:hypothetical protein